MGRPFAHHGWRVCWGHAGDWTCSCAVDLAAQMVDQIDAGDQAKEAAAVKHNNHMAAFEHRQQIAQRCRDLDSLDAGAHGAVDRKSTRLNSSHVRISYAVFCLKKKKKK